MSVQYRIVLEPSAQGMVDATSAPPFLYEMEPAAALPLRDEGEAYAAKLRAALGTA